MTLATLNRMPSRDAWLIYEYFVDRFQGAPGSIESTSFDFLASRLNSLRLTTERGAAFTAVVVKNRLAQLERLGVIVREKIAGALFSLGFRPFVADPNETQNATAEKIDLYGGRSLFDFVDDSTPEKVASVVSSGCDQKGATVKTSACASAPSVQTVETSAPISTRAKKSKMKTDLDADSAKSENLTQRPIVKNKLINKPLKEEKHKEKTSAEKGTAKSPTLNELVDKVDKTHPQVAALRSKIVGIIWEPWLRSDLVDRLVAAVYYRWASPSKVFAYCRHAVDQRDVYKATNGRRGSEFIWSALCPFVKQLVDEKKGKPVQWQETRRGLEVEPAKQTYKPILRD